MSDIFEEVEESLAADRTSELWKKYWPFIVTVVAAIIIGVGAQSYLTHKRDQEIETAGRAFETALKAVDAENIDDIRSNLKKAADSQKGFAALSSHYLAGAELRLSGDEKAAYDALNAAADGDEPLARMARLKAAYILADTAGLAELEAYVEPLISSESAFAPLARELIAAKAMAGGDYARARTDYNFLTLSMDASDGVRSRAAQALAVLPALIDAENTAPEEESDAIATEPSNTAVEE